MSTSARRPTTVSSPRLAYDDLSSPAEMHVDCVAAGANLRLEDVRDRLSRPAPSLHFDDFPQDPPKRRIEVSEAAQRLANALHLHLD